MGAEAAPWRGSIARDCTICLYQSQHLAAQHPRKTQPAQQTNHQNNIAHTGAQERHGGEGHHQVRQGEKHIGETHQDTVDPAPENPTHQANRRADDRDQENGQNANLDRGLGTVDETAENIPPLIVGAEHV
jgi:hypothetical protein